MARATPALAPLLLLLTACQARDAREPAEPEIGLKSACEPVMFEDSPLTHCIADPALHAIRMVDADADGDPYRSLAAYAESRAADAAPVVFAMNGGMYDEDGAPIGYYVENGERLHLLNRNDGPGNFHLKPNGIFFGDLSADWHVYDTDRFAAEVDERPDFATQSGPMLVIKGELHEAFDPDGESLAVRNGVGVDPAGRAHFVISEAPISFGKFGRYFRDVLRTPNALFLDGNVSQLWDPARGRLDSDRQIGPIILVEMREDRS